MEKTKKTCWNCGNFDAYYTRGFCRFDKTCKGSCSAKKEIVDKSGYCDRWRNTFTIRSRRKEFTLKALDQILSDISAIRQILEEEDEERKTHPYHKDV